MNPFVAKSGVNSHRGGNRKPRQGQEQRQQQVQPNDTEHQQPNDNGVESISGMLRELKMPSYVWSPWPWNCEKFMVRKRYNNVVVEGNIGSGKSTFIRRLDRGDGDYALEPVEYWMNYHGRNMLKLIGNNSNMRFKFQVLVMMSLFQRNKGGKRFTERSVDTVHRVFALARWYDFIEVDLLKDLAACLKNESDGKPDLIIYIRTKPGECKRRVMQRNRAGEEHVGREYLNHLDKLHDDWLLHSAIDTPVIILENNSGIDVGEINNMRRALDGEISLYEAYYQG